MTTLADISRAASNAELLAELAELYAELDRRIAAHQPICRNRGACCKFDTFGHKLYVTTLELAYFTARHHGHAHSRAATVRERSSTLASNDQGPAGPDQVGISDLSLRDLPVLNETSPTNNSCPFQQNGLCTTRAGRPIGCRVFFCESSDQGWQSELTEWAISRLRELHERFEVPYSYAEWLTALAETFPE